MLFNSFIAAFADAWSALGNTFIKYFLASSSLSLLLSFNSNRIGNLRPLVSNGIIEVKIYEYGHPNHISRFRKISKEKYVDTETGEIVHFQSHPCRNGDVSSAKRNWNRSFEHLRRLINNNFIGAANELHIILTYKSSYQMTDRGTASMDFKNFWKRLKYHYGPMDYIVIYEPDQRGIWHIHVLVKKTDTGRLFIDNNILQEIWGKGFTNVKRTSGNDNIGAYFTVFPGSQSRNKKTSRIQYYEKHKKLYTKSRGILPPSPLYMTYEKAQKFLQGHKLVFQEGYSIIQNSDGRELNRFYNIQYNDRKN